MTDRREAGFTLIEILMALAILTIGLTVLFSVLGPAAENAAVADSQRSALAGAQSILAELGHSRPLVDGKYAGDLASGQHWLMEIAPYPGPDAQARGALAGHQVTLNVTWGQNGRPRTLAFETTLLTASTP